jgi:hypothetical protein
MLTADKWSAGIWFSKEIFIKQGRDRFSRSVAGSDGPVPIKALVSINGIVPGMLAMPKLPRNASALPDARSR